MIASEPGLLKKVCKEGARGPNIDQTNEKWSPPAIGREEDDNQLGVQKKKAREKEELINEAEGEKKDGKNLSF